MFLEGNSTYLLADSWYVKICTMRGSIDATSHDTTSLSYISHSSRVVNSASVGTMESVGFFTVSITYPSFPLPLRDIFMALTHD
jgi:hypothetical protein